MGPVQPRLWSSLLKIIHPFLLFLGPTFSWRRNFNLNLKVGPNCFIQSLNRAILVSFQALQEYFVPEISFKVVLVSPRYSAAGLVRENSTIDLNKTTSSLFWQVLVMLDLWSVCGRNLPLRSTDTSASLLTTQTTAATGLLMLELLAGGPFRPFRHD